MVGYLED